MAIPARRPRTPPSQISPAPATTHPRPSPTSEIMLPYRSLTGVWGNPWMSM